MDWNELKRVVTCSLAHMCAEVFACELVPILEAIFEHPNALVSLLQFVEQPSPLDCRRGTVR